MKTLVVGNGRVARALLGAGVGDLSWSRKGGGPVPGPVDIVVCAVSDDAIAEVASHVAPAQDPKTIYLHCAGAVSPLEAFSSVAAGGRGLVHPLRSFAGSPEDARLQGTVFAVSGDDAGRAAAERIVARVRGVAVRVALEELPRYHAAAVLASSHVVGLIEAAVEILGSVGFPRSEAAKSAIGLCRSALDNAQTLGPAKGLTGPIARGDVEVVRKHLDSLGRDFLPLYRATGFRVLELAEEKGQASARALAEIAQLLADPAQKSD